MNPTVGIAVILTVLQAAHCQMIKDLSACLLGQSLRVDCRYENKTSNPLTYEFSITKDNRKHVIHSTISVSENIYRSRANVTMHKNLVCLYLQSFTTSDEGVYMCELKATNDYTGNQIKNITVIKDKLEKCAGFSLLIQNTSWLLLLLLSLPLLQAVDFVPAVTRTHALLRSVVALLGSIASPIAPPRSVGWLVCPTQPASPSLWLWGLPLLNWGNTAGLAGKRRR
uniref:Thy-1 membrane glycoprotein n=1 Tax=Amazona collaria TaxID=241587 RepID=A0A8B9G112_9PSIT